MKKSRMILGALCLAGAFAVTACSPQKQDTAAWETITAEEAKARMDSGDELVVVDVRTMEEYLEKHIAGAIVIPNETIDKEQPEALPNLDAEILLYCRSGNRSAQAAEKLADMGYTNVKDFGGIQDWPYETVAGEEPVPEAGDATPMAVGGKAPVITVNPQADKPYCAHN